MTTSVAPPTPQEVSRKLSIHSVKPKVRRRPCVAVGLPPIPDAPVQVTTPAGGLVSGTESDSDSVLSPEYASPLSAGGSLTQPPLTAIVERRSAGEDSEDDEDERDVVLGIDTATHEDSTSDIKAGYLWKKGERRKVRLVDCVATVCRVELMSASRADLEAAVVRVTPRASRVLQDVRGVQAPPPARPARCAYVHARVAQAARQHVRGRVRRTHVLPSSGVAG